MTPVELMPAEEPDDDNAACIRCRQPRWLCECAPTAEPSDVVEISNQIAEASTRLDADPSAWLRFSWPDLHEITGPLAPGGLTLVAARTGQGKTTFLLNVMNDFHDAKQRGLYMGLEQKPWELRTKWACLRLGIPQRIAIQNQWHEWPNGEALRRAARAELLDQGMTARRDLVWFDPVTHVTAAGIAKACQRAHRDQRRWVIVDHIDRVAHGKGRDPFAELSETIRLCKELAGEYSLHVILASQVNRLAVQGDALAPHFPPQAHTMRGAGTKEEEMDLGLGIWKPLKPGLTRKDLEPVRARLQDVATVLEPWTMGVVNMKDRADGSREGRQCRLSLRDGKLVDRSEEEARADEAARHGIHTHRAIA